MSSILIEDTPDIDQLNKEAWSINRSDALRAIELSEEALRKSTEIKYKKGMALAYKTLGAANIWISKNEEALRHSFEAVQLFKESGDKKNEAETYYNIGVNFRYLSDYDSAIKYQNQCYNLYNELKDEPGMAEALNGLGTVYYSIEQNDKALEVLLESQKLCLKHNCLDIYVKVLEGLGETYYNLKNYKGALDYCNKSVTICRQIGSKQVEAFALDGLGRTHTALKNYKEALQNYKESLKIREEMGFKAGVAITLNNIGSLHVEKGDLEEGIKCLEESFQLSQNINSKEGIYRASEKLSEVYETTGQLDKAISFFKLFHSTREEVRNEKTNQLVKSVELQHKVLHSQAEKALLEEKAKELASYSNNLILLGEIGQQIISHLNVASIVETVYGHVNNLMDATGFGIGLHIPESNKVIFPLYIEDDERFENISYDLEEKDKLTVICFNNKKEIIINDFPNQIMQYVGYHQAPLQGKVVESILYFPLIAKEKVMGVITVQSFKKHAYSAYHVNMLRNLAAFAAIALENAKMYEQEEKKVEQRTLEVIKKKEEVEQAYQNNKLLSEIGQQITSSLSIEDIAVKLHGYCNQLMDASCFSIRLYNPEKNHIEYKYGYERGERQENFIVSMEDVNNFSVWCITNKKEIFINDIAVDYKKYTKEIKVVFGDMPHSLIFCPLMRGDKVLGCFTVQSFEKNAYRDYHLDIIKTLASYTAIALDNANLYEHMEENVKARTVEVVKQKEALEKANENTRLLSKIGNDITSTLSIEEIITKVYANVNNLMDASVLGIGVYNKSSNALVFPGSIEKGKKLPPHPLPLDMTERPAVKCFLSQEDHMINNFSDSKLKAGIIKQKPVAGENTESLIYVPITHNDKKIGVITVQSFKPDAYTDYHLQILKTLAVYVAIAIDNASLYTNMEERVKERTGEIEKAYENNRLLSEIGQQITSSLNFENIFEKLHGYVNQLMNADCFGIRIYNAEAKTIEYKYEIEKGVRDYEVLIVPLNPEENLSSWCVVNKKEVLINDSDVESKKYIKTMHILVGEKPNSLLFLPIFVGEKILGVITVQSFSKNAYTNYHLDILKSLASYTAIALENASLYEHMEEKVNERTQEVVKQKEEVEKTYENTRLLNQIGKDITATLSIESIIDKVYNNVNNLMDATTFGIGVYNEEKKEIVFPATIEKGIKYPPYSYSIDNPDRPAVWCYNSQKDYVINHFSEEFVKSNKVKDYQAKYGENPEAIIYVPVTQNDKKIGVITVQSFTPNAYNDYHLQILKNLAVYVAIAIDNASLYTGMEKRVKERTEEIEKNYQDTLLLGQIAEAISASLSVETIISKVYENVNKLMKADCFGIGILKNTTTNELEFNGFVENDQLMPNFAYASNDPNRLAAHCFTGKKEIMINDYTVEYKKYIKGIQAPVSGKDSSSIIYLPLYSKGIGIGVLTVQSFDKNAYTSYHLNLLKNLAVSIGIALDNANLYQNLEEKVNERTLEVVKQKEEIEKTYQDTRLLSQIGKDITSTLSLEEIIDKVYVNVNTLMDATGFGIGVHKKETHELYFPLYIEGNEKYKDTIFSLDSNDRLPVICFNKGEELILNDIAVDVKKYLKNPPKISAGSDQVAAVIYMPLFLKDEILGVITVQSFTVNAYSEYHLNILRNLAVYISIAIDNASLYENMEVRVMQRTAEVTKQKEQLEKNFADNRLITQVTKDITSSLSVETIVSKVYENVNTLMKAESFGIGIHNPSTESLQFPGFIEHSKKLDFFEFSMSDKNRFAVWCFDNEKEIVINNLSTEYNKYIKDLKAPVAGESPESILYLPLYTKEKKIGVITVQSFTKNAYSDYQVNILRNIALSVAVALDNANLYQNLEEKVKERTLEVVKQKEEIEKTYENTRLLSKIGTDITSTLSLAKIIDKVYDNINTLMDATGFGVGVHDATTGNVVYPLYIEGEERWKNIVYKKEDTERLTTICFQQKREIIINDFDTEIHQYVNNYLAPLKGRSVASLIYLPLILKDKPLGVITVQSFQPKAYSDYHVQILKNLGVYVAIAIDNAALYQNLEDRVVERTTEVTKQKEQLEKNFQDTKLIAQITKDITSSLSVETIVSKVYENVNTLMKAESFGIGLYNSTEKSLQFNGYIEHSKKLDFFEFPVSDENRFAVWCYENEREIIINDIQLEFNKYVKVRKPPVGQSPESIIYLPLYTKEKKIGVITVQSFSKHAYSEYQVNILRNIALAVAIAIDNANLYENLEEKVKERSAEVMEQKRIIEATNKDITDSIKYAKKIQLALIPDADNLRKSFNESFIYYRPKDIVSGDFYWIENFPSAVVFAAADCTGHGVPGAFMSLICNDLMSQVIKDPSVTTPAQALTILDDKLRGMLNKSSDHSSNDGMDIALCAYYPKKMLLQFAGAHRPLLLMRNGELIEYKPSKHSIGGYLSGKKVFDDNNIQLQKGDQVYILTDGYADQFGGEKGKKFKFKRLEKLISSIYHLPMDEQHDMLDAAFTSWRGKHEQVDDVCVIGIKI